jgi:hypothetical protein
VGVRDALVPLKQHALNSSDVDCGAPCARDLFASLDWSRTPLGPIESWPQRLRTTAEIVLGNRYPMIVLWGSDLIQVAYNDAYARLIGWRHPGAMGQKDETAWPEVWHINEPIYNAVLAQGREFYFEDALYPLERNNWREEVYLTISYGPVRDDHERFGGILVTMVETTRNVLAERRLRWLRDVAARTARVRSIPEIGSIAVNVLAENAGDVLFASIVAAEGREDFGPAHTPLGAHPQLLGSVGLDECDAYDLAPIAAAVVGADGSALITLGARRNGEPYPGGAFGKPVRQAYVAGLPPATGSAQRGWLVVGLSPALPPDARISRIGQRPDFSRSACVPTRSPRRCEPG